ncbi:MAG: glycoside hydrolase domain-containing protein [Armatimonadota bacterium]
MTLLYVCAILGFLCNTAFADERACVTVPPCSNPPSIDTTTDFSQWKEAAVISNLIDSDGITTADPNSVIYLMADGKKLYVAAKLYESNPVGPQGFVRSRDDSITDDDSIQVYIAPEDLTKTKNAEINYGGYAGSFDNWYADIKNCYEFAVNCKGSIGDSWNDNRDWNASWKAKVGRSSGIWTVKMEIPFSVFKLTSRPINTLWGFNIFRIRQTKRSGFVNHYYGGYTPLPIGAMYLSSVPVFARQSSTNMPKPGANTLEMMLVNNSNEPKDVEISMIGSDKKPDISNIHLTPTSNQEIVMNYILGDQGSVSADYLIKINELSVPLISGKVGLVLPEKIDIDLRYFAVPSKITGDIRLQPDSKAVKAVLSSGQNRKEIDLQGSKGTTISIPVSGVVGDKISAGLQVFASDGTLLAEKKIDSIIPVRYPWMQTKAGLPLKVLPPWTPVKVSGKEIKIIGRNMKYTDSALPSQINSAGKDMLASPIRLQIGNGGKQIVWSSKAVKIVNADETHAKLESLWTGNDFDLKITSEVDYDGFTWNEVTLMPHGAKTLDKVSLLIPMTTDMCKLYCLGNSQQAGAISPKGLRGPIPDSYDLWIGNERRGISWLVESVEWIKSKNTSQQIDISYGKSSALWKCAFIDTPTIISKPYTMRFALHYTPSKPVSLKKYNIYHPMAQYDLPTALLPSQYIVSAKGNINPSLGTFECWVKPVFDPNEPYDSSKDRSIYNRKFLSLVDSQSQSIDLYYNADHRNFILVKGDGTGKYPIIFGGGLDSLPKDKWSYIALSWSDKLRLRVNDKVIETGLSVPLVGDVSNNRMTLHTNAFSVSDMRISSIARSLDSVPVSALSCDSNTLYLDDFVNIGMPLKTSSLPDVLACKKIDGPFAGAMTADTNALLIDYLAENNTGIVIFHENWSRYQGYPDQSQIPKLKAVADACHARRMRFLIYFNQHMSDAAPEWKGMEWDFGLGGMLTNYHRDYDEIVQNGYMSCVNGPFGDLLLDGIAKIADGADIDGVYMDGTSVAWPCSNPTHPGCGVYAGDGKYTVHMPLRATRKFLMRLRNIFVQRGKDVYMDAHTGGGINVATTSLCDAYLDGEALARYKNGYRLPAESFAAACMGKQYGYRGEFLPSKFSVDEGLAVSLVHDCGTRGEPAPLANLLAQYDDNQTTFIPYWDHSPLYHLSSDKVLASVYLKPKSALMVLGSQTQDDTQLTVDLSGLIKKLGQAVQPFDPMNAQKLDMKSGKVAISIGGRNWRVIELK